MLGAIGVKISGFGRVFVVTVLVAWGGARGGVGRVSW